jgi:hypothetical protein
MAVELVFPGICRTCGESAMASWTADTAEERERFSFWRDMVGAPVFACVRIGSLIACDCPHAFKHAAGVAA